MTERVARVLRALQSEFPAVRTAKFAAYNWATENFGLHVEPDFRLLARLPRVGLAVDIGGNWGQSILALKRFAKPERIVSFEPNPVLGERLRRVMRQHQNVEVETCALSDAKGEFDLFVPRYKNYVYDGLASLDEDSARFWLSHERMAFFDDKKVFLDRHRVPVRTLDSYALRPDIVKIDVQGLEFKVVKGGEQTFRESVPITIIEAADPQLVDYLAGIGMDAYRWTGTKLIKGDTNGLNVIFLHQRRLRDLGF